MKLVIAGGGTGGHLFPGIAVAEALQDAVPSAEVLFVGTERGIEVRAVPKAGFPLELIEVGALKRVSLAQRMKTLWSLPSAVWQARRILTRFGADAVLGVGGYASGPVLVAARTLGLPTAICEQNSVPGMTNRILGRLVNVIYGTFESARSFFPSERYVVVGNPVRRSFVAAARAGGASAPEEGLVFVFGGSQGARPLNQTAPAALGILRARGRDVRALHQSGASELDAVRAAYEAAAVPATVETFIDDMVATYRRADVVVCRAGATSCAELTALGVPAILVPFPQAADDHQTKNAAELRDADAAVLLPQTEMTPERLADEIEAILSDRSRRTRLSERALGQGRLGAAAAVAAAAVAGFPSVTRRALVAELEVRS